MVEAADSRKTAEVLLSGLILDHLYRWVEQTLGIRAGDDALEKL
jgi:hypothetical protein